MPINRADLLNPRPNLNEEVVAFNNQNNIAHISTFNTNFNNYDQFIYAHFSRLRTHQSTADVYSNKMLLLSKRRPPNLKSILTKARLNVSEAGGLFKCNNPRCNLCTIIITGTNIEFKPTNFKFHTKCHMTCNTLNCIYVIEWQGCLKMYIGETNLRFPSDLHRDHTKKNKGLGVNKHMHSFCENSTDIASRIMPFLNEYK